MAKRLFAPEKKRRWGLILLPILLLVIILSALFINNALNSYPKMRLLMVTVPSLPNKAEGLTLLHISDLDGNIYGENQERLMVELKNQNYHGVFVTGDITDNQGSAGAMIEIKNNLPSDIPVFFIPGDEDPPVITDSGHSSWVASLINAGCILVDRPIKWEVSGVVAWVLPGNLLTADIEAMRFSIEQSNVSSAFSDYNKRIYADIDAAKMEMLPEHMYIAMSHAPFGDDNLAYLRDEGEMRMRNFPGRLMLLLSGHLCNGQARLPYFGAIYAPKTSLYKGEGFFKKDIRFSGLFTMRAVVQHISPGLGGSKKYPSWLQIRLFNPPEITLLKLTQDYY
ncbi:MAG TPA: metallophosphoesterase [Christensenellaceae bacterium]|nr:metallophosphoesterase [Christensenellaceae bacterium]